MVFIMLTNYQISQRLSRIGDIFKSCRIVSPSTKVIIPYEQLQTNLQSKLLTKMRRLQVNIFNLIEKIFQWRISKNVGLLEGDQTALFLSQNRGIILDSHNYQLLYVIKPWKVSNLQTYKPSQKENYIMRNLLMWIS